VELPAPQLGLGERIEKQTVVVYRILREAAVGHDQPRGEALERFASSRTPPTRRRMRRSAGLRQQGGASHKETCSLARPVVVVLRDRIAKGSLDALAVQ